MPKQLFRTRPSRLLERHVHCPCCRYDLFGTQVEPSWQHMPLDDKALCLITWVFDCPRCHSELTLERWPGDRDPAFLSMSASVSPHVKCAGCGYNLHGLTVYERYESIEDGDVCLEAKVRCPECAFRNKFRSRLSEPSDGWIESGKRSASPRRLCSRLNITSGFPDTPRLIALILILATAALLRICL